MRKSTIISVKKGQKHVAHLTPVSLERAGVREVQDLQKWILAKPEVLGEPLLVLDDQFSKFEGARDRPDILCLDREGHIVVVELKRTDTADYADLQSLRYAAMLRSLTLDDAARIFSRSRRGKEMEMSESDAKSQLSEFMEGEDGEVAPNELLSEPRIIIASSGFSKQVLTTVDYLRAHEIDVTCISLSAYSTGDDEFILVPDVVIPIREIEELTIKIRRKEEDRQSASRARLRGALDFLFDNGEIKGGELLFLKHQLPDEVRAHYQETDPTFRATVVIEGGAPHLRWERDGNLYAPSKLASKVFKEFLPDHPTHLSVNGSVHWGSQNERLSDMRDRISGSKVD